jgi:hypothetical protein
VRGFTILYDFCFSFLLQGIATGDGLLGDFRRRGWATAESPTRVAAARSFVADAIWFWWMRSGLRLGFMCERLEEKSVG